MGLMRDCTHSDRPLEVALVMTFALLGEPLRIHQSMIEPSFPTWLGIPSVQYTWVYLFGDFQLSMYLLHLVRDFQLSIYLGYLFRGFPTFSIPDPPGWEFPDFDTPVSQVSVSPHRPLSLLLETHLSFTPPSHDIALANFWPVTNHSLSVIHWRYVVHSVHHYYSSPDTGGTSKSRSEVRALQMTRRHPFIYS